MAKEAEATKKPGKSELLEEAADLLERIEKAEEACELAGSEAEIRKEAYRTARASYGERIEELRKLCRARKENHPLLQQKAAEEKSAETPAATSATETVDEDVPTESVAPSADGDGQPEEASWREFTLESIEAISPSVVKALKDAGIAAAGQLADRMAGRHDWWQDEDIRNIGESRAARLADLIAGLRAGSGE